MVRIDLFKLYQRDALNKHSIIDLSDVPAQKRYYNKGRAGYGVEVYDLHPSLFMSARVQEVLLMWRGSLPFDAFEVLRTYVLYYLE